jgi:hypothetical protein
VLAFVGVLALAVVGACLFFSQPEFSSAKFLIGIGVFAAAIILAACLIFAWGFVTILLKVEANTFRMYDALRDLQAAIQECDQHLNVIADNAQLSDTARAISHRGRERTALRHAINEEILHGDWEAAYALVELLEARHGYKNEATRLRSELDLSRDRDRQRKLHEAVEQARARIVAQDWDGARREMDRLLAEHPDSREVQELPKLFAKTRNDHKRRLLKAWDESVQRNEIDRGIEILQELDQYLTPSEAAALEESARGVFRAKLHNLGVRFSLAVADLNWDEALAVGRQIDQEFPNSRMAEEVRQRMHILSKRAEDAAAAQEQSQEPTPPEPAGD